ncbi:MULTISPECIES: Tn3 family transposase [unclassified Cetobacterium]|uniref:Tn3 family transposase n=1 Tax=unclassified Cetobacterium TaxID=2630983 RepID=UPI000647AC4A|nr:MULTISPECIES: Tn3 family transposase [unclassified Cetobacterium]
MEYRNTILSKRDREDILKFLVNDKNLNTQFILSKNEILRIKKLKKPSHQLGYALQLMYLKNKNINIIEYVHIIPEKIVKFLSEQLNCTAKNLNEYWEIKNTKTRYFQEILDKLDYIKFEYDPNLEKEFYRIAFSNGSPLIMVKEVLKLLKGKKIVAPPLAIIEHLLWIELEKSENKIYQNIVAQIKDFPKLYSLLNVETTGTSTYSRLKNINVNSNSNGAKELLKAIKELDEFGVSLDLSFLSDNKLKYLALEIQKSDKFRIDKFFNDNKKYSYLALFVYFKRKEFVDMVIEVTSTYAHTILKRSRKKSRIYTLQNQENLRLNFLKLKEVVKKVINLEGVDELKKLQNLLVPLNEELEAQEEELEEIDFLLKSGQSFNYTNELLECIEFNSNTKPEFINYLKEFPNLKYKKKIELDTSIFSTQWQKNIKKLDSNKKIVELALLYSIKDYIRSGDIFVRESKKYNSFDHYLVETENLVGTEEGKSFLESLKLLLNIPKKLNFATDISVDEKSIFSDKIYSYFPKISMTEILYEVNSWTGVLEHIKENTNSSEKQKALVATLMSNGHNIGFSKMSISSSIDESTLRRTSEYYFNNEALSKAQKNLVNYHHSLDIVKNWGNGENSSSDGMRVPINSKTIYADYNAHYGNKGGGIYRHVSDQYTPFYVQMLEGRDSNHVLDGLLYHESELQIYGHSTDTAGYTEQMFALTYLLGFNFKPRIKNLEQQQLYAFENIEIDNRKFKKINEKIILENYNEILRMIESIKCGKVKASLILNKINSYNRDNGVAKGLKEIGRILKTKYILEYFSNGDLRKEVQQMLNKGESINSVARLMFFGKNGRLNESSIESQLEKASCLNIMLSSLIVWNSRYLEKIYSIAKNEEWFSEDEFKRVSPLGTQHVNFLGKYIFEEIKIETKDGLREIKV